jgi:hypothetical protein
MSRFTSCKTTYSKTKVEEKKQELEEFIHVLVRMAKSKQATRKKWSVLEYFLR